MATNFRGYLLKNSAGATGSCENWIAEKSYKSTPNQREDILAYREEISRLLHRDVADGTKTAISFTTIDGMTLNEKIQLMNFFNCNNKERKVSNLIYWNDDINAYSTGNFYIANIEWVVDYHDSSTIYYAPVTIDLVEY